MGGPVVVLVRGDALDAEWAGQMLDSWQHRFETYTTFVYL